MGTNQDDTLTGTSGEDFIFGLGGNDIISGLQENDFLSSGNGNDTVLGGGGFDEIDVSGDQDYGFQDQVICGAGAEDIVNADDNDEVDEASCENINPI